MERQLFFFFQAEDGIRDIGVTGVQTCALPICSRWLAWMVMVTRLPPASTKASRLLKVIRRCCSLRVRWKRSATAAALVASCVLSTLMAALEATTLPHEIGRASCRERE